MQGFVEKFLASELEVLKLCAPVWLYITGTAAITMNACSYFAAQMGPNYLAGISLGEIIIENFLMYFMLGYSSVFDVYGPQLCGKNEEEKLGKLMVKSVVQGAAVFLVLLFPTLALIPLMKLLPVDEELRHEVDEIQDIAATFMQLVAGTIFLDYVNEITTKFLVNQKAMVVVYVMGVVQTLAMILASYIFVIELGFYTAGLALAFLSSRAIFLIGSSAVMAYKRAKWNLNRHLLTREIFKKWSNMVKMGLAGGINLFFVYSCYTVATFIAPACGGVTVEAFALLVLVETLSFPATVALTYATAIQVGNGLGEGDTEKVKYFVRLAIFNLIAERIIFGAIFLSCRHWYFALFTSDPEVIQEAWNASYLLILFLTLEILQEVLSRGILIVFGRDKFVAVVSLVSCLCFGMPATITMVYATELKTTRLFVGMMVQRFVCITCLCARLAVVDYSEEISRCDERLANEFEPTVASESTEILYRTWSS